MQLSEQPLVMDQIFGGCLDQQTLHDQHRSEDVFAFREPIRCVHRTTNIENVRHTNIRKQST